MANKKSEIIAQLLAVADAEMTLTADEQECCEGIIASEIRARLEEALKDVRSDVAIRTCEDFAELDVECCDTCHSEYPYLELALVDIENGGNAWICCALDRVLNPLKHEKWRNSPEYKEIMEMLALTILISRMLTACPVRVYPRRTPSPDTF